MSAPSEPGPDPVADPIPRRDPTPLVVPPVSLEGDTVRLVPLTPAHAAGLTALAEPEVFEHYNVVLGTREDLEGFIAQALAAAERGTECPFAILERATGEVLGTTRYLDIQREHRTLEIGHTWLGRRAWRTGVNTECKALLLAHAFETLGVMRVQFKTNRRNTRSRAAIERLGARFEGILRQHLLIRGGLVRDSAYYSILDTEWPEVKARLERLRTGR
ncbi:GNAT family N-acetyltransferase [Archangium primigenium]|uniref:GNAT family N-acetyltransferase n=1 Tax=[Archangium] primigenium TaxID=2792470 RepID=UPI001959EAF0|nr:GNAT family N-acetyltransferase [Archangium primigenium]MBM7119025.1 GNAT family N-acetyltransferase [Archangium primigenium]